MIRPVTEKDIPACIKVIRESFLTVAEEFHFTKENAPRFTAFSVDEDRLSYHFHVEHRPMFVYTDDDKIVGYYSLFLEENSACELNNLAVLPAYRHKGIGKILLEHAEKTAAALHCTVMHIGIVEENRVLRRWYEQNGAVHTGTKKFDFFPFTCGYLQMPLPKIQMPLPKIATKDKTMASGLTHHAITDKAVKSNEASLLRESDIGEILPLPITEKIEVKPPVKFQFHTAKNKKKHKR